MKDRIVCLVGPSASGKTTLAYHLAERYGYNVIESYTTRPPRHEGEKGHIYLDVKDNEPAPWHNIGIIAYTYYNGEHYWSERHQYQGKGISLYIIDPPGVKMLRNTVDDAGLLVIALHVDENTRESRLLARGGVFNRQGKDYLCLVEKVASTLEYDRQAFSVVPCDYVVDGDRPVEELGEVVREIIEGTQG